MNQRLTGTVEVSTYKDGLLSRLAHDLRLKVERFEIGHDGTSIEATFDPASLTVVTALVDGNPVGALSDGDRGEIRQNIRDKVLQTSRYPEVRFEGTGKPEGDVVRIAGTLTLRGQRQPVEFSAQREDGRYLGEVELIPSRFGIAPYKALLGAIKLQDRVRVRFDLG
ncbi:MAG: YceI family protein [Polyangiaceae bacterium]|nr:YceI family protein [Polyangiaceae bacterium]